MLSHAQTGGSNHASHKRPHALALILTCKDQIAQMAAPLNPKLDAVYKASCPGS